MNKESDYGYFDQELSKQNRRRKQEEAGKPRMVVGAKPPLGVHQEARRQRDRRANIAVKKAIKKR